MAGTYNLTLFDTITLDFSGADLVTDQTYYGGFVTDANVGGTILNGATFDYVGLNGATIQYEGMLTEPTADFAIGTVTDGKVMEFRVMEGSVPEPSTWAFVTAGTAFLLLGARQGRRACQKLQGPRQRSV